MATILFFDHARGFRWKLLKLTTAWNEDEFRFRLTASGPLSKYHKDHPICIQHNGDYKPSLRTWEVDPVKCLGATPIGRVPIWMPLELNMIIQSLAQVLYVLRA